MPTSAGIPTHDTASSAADVPRFRPLVIGSVVVDPPLLQAPMAGFTNYAYRQIVRELGGAGLQATEMISARGFIHIESNGVSRRPKTPSPNPLCEDEGEGFAADSNDLEVGSNLTDRLWGVRDEPRPLAVQIWDNDPETLAEVGARLAHDYRVSIVDINFGCPVRQVTERAHSGSYLLGEPERVGAIIERVVKACAPTPVTAKIRLGRTRDTVNAIDVAQTVEEAGAAALTVHGRTAQDFFKGSADWQRISDIKPHLKRLRLIGNGDLDSAAAVVEAFRRYDVDGVMIARAALSKPWLFRQAKAALSGQEIPPDLTLTQQRELLEHHYRLIVQRFGERKGTVLMRKYACCYAQGKAGARAFRTHVSNVSTAEEFREVVELYYPRENSEQTATATPAV
jgi:tRNA-dihydrouridine synthase B